MSRAEKRALRSMRVIHAWRGRGARFAYLACLRRGLAHVHVPARLILVTVLFGLEGALRVHADIAGLLRGELRECRAHLG